jgi:glycosyltransferase involved in cell wall biosynthesis
LEIEFAGWVSAKARAALLSGSHLLVMPSLWPEPFGWVGLESAAHGVPAVAFAVGGITDWLRDGVNGHLASGDPPTSANLADAIVRCLRDPEAYANLRRGAAAVARQYNVGTHRSALLKVLERAAVNA